MVLLYTDDTWQNTPVYKHHICTLSTSAQRPPSHNLDSIPSFPSRQMLPQHQVLVLRHPSNDNLDIQLEGDDEELSLRECGVTNNSLLTLHSLYTCAPPPPHAHAQLRSPCRWVGSSAWGGLLLVLFLRSGPDTLTRKEEGSAEEGAEMNGMPLYTLTTRLGPKEADHSYNGIIFDVESKAPYEVVVTAVWVAGMLGNVRAFVRDQPWSGHDLRPKARQSMWGNRYIIEKEGWEQVADVQCSPSWDKCREIIFDEPLRLLPGQVRPSFHPLPLHSLTERSGDKLGVLIDRERWNPAPSSRGRHCISRLQVPHPEGTVTQ
jgi:hypothetical protein